VQPLQPIVIRFGRLGDMVMVTAVLQLLHRRFSNPCVIVGAGPWNSQLFVGHPDVARTWTFERHFPFILSRAWWSVLRELRRSAPSPIYVLEPESRQLTRIRRMLALSGINPGRCVFAADEHLVEGEHWVDVLIRVAQRTPPALEGLVEGAVSQTGRKAAPRLSVLETERSAMEAWLRAQGWSGQKLVLIQPGNFRTMSRRREKYQRPSADDKSWPLENWVRLLQRINAHSPEHWLLLCGAPEEASLLQRIQAACALPAVMLAAVPLRELLALCELADSMVSIDTGPAHAAAALGLPLVVMYGAQPPATWLPRSPSGSAVIGLGGPPASTRVDQIGLDDVFRAWCSLPSIPVKSPVKSLLAAAAV
jgi:heptosyltransferase-2/heptosyltransferase-3